MLHELRVLPFPWLLKELLPLMLSTSSVGNLLTTNAFSLNSGPASASNLVNGTSPSPAFMSRGFALASTSGLPPHFPPPCCHNWTPLREDGLRHGSQLVSFCKNFKLDG